MPSATNVGVSHPSHLPVRPPNLIDWIHGSSSPPTSQSISDHSHSRHGPKRLILCFDGTAENFEGNASDSNVVKLYGKFDRTIPNQLHYYQPGVGTYPNHSSMGSGILSKVWNKLVQKFDQAFATSFSSHVMNGYRFLMRYYEQGDEIYIFGFSRGAFIARFLARFISQVGLVARGNEHLVHFAYSNFLDYQLGTGRDDIAEYLLKFTAAFCRYYNPDKAGKGLVPGVQVHFLGLFDAVNSVSILDLQLRTTKQPLVHGTAKHIRHAVATDERRVKFKVALLTQDSPAKDIADEDIKEVWFPGAHTDVGGGVVPDRKKKTATTFQQFTQGVRSMTGFGNDAHRRRAPLRTLQLSDIALKWMIDELDLLPGDGIKWNSQKDDFLEYYRNHIHEVMDSRIHNALTPTAGKILGSLFWQWLEFLPLKRWKYENGEWQVTREPNLARYRDIPHDAVFHRSLVERIEYDGCYHPQNRVWPGQARKPVTLDRINTDIVKDEESHPFARASEGSGISFKKLEPVVARFDLHSTGNEEVEQGVEDNTYCVMELDQIEHVHGGRGYLENDGAGDDSDVSAPLLG